MISIPFEIFHFIVAPLLSAQLLLLVLLYFSIFCRRVLTGYTLHSIFLCSYVLYLVGHTLQQYTDLQTAIYILFSRVFLFFGIGLPSMLIAVYLQCGISLSTRIKAFLYGASIFAVCTLISIQDLANYNYIFSEVFEQSLPFSVVNNMALFVISFHLVFLLLIPTGLLLRRELHDDRNPMRISFLLGAIVIASSHLASIHIRDSYWIIYFGAVVTSLCWVWAVYYDVKSTRGQAHAVKDELLWMLRSGNYKADQDQLNHLWKALASSADGDIQRYKLQVREVLTRLAELSISAGADGEHMLARANESAQAIDNSANVDEVLSIATKETRELGELIRQQPMSVVTKAKSYIEINYAQVVDIKAISKHCGSSQSYLMRYFKEETGQTINQYLTSLRIDIAKRLLAQKSITETAFEVGFNNSNYFSTVFKKVTGITPGQFQETLTHK